MLKTSFILFIGVLSISFAAIFIRFCDDVHGVMIATYRLTLASLVLLVAAKWKGLSFRSLPRRHLLAGMVGGLFLAIHFSAWISSLKFTSVASSVVLVTTNPLWVGLFSYLIFRERQPAVVVLGIVLSVGGSAVLAASDSGFHSAGALDTKALLGDGLALLGALMASGYLMVGSKLREKVDTFTYIAIVYSFSALFLLLFSLASGLPFTGYKPASYLFMALLAIVPQLIGHTAINWSLEHVKTSVVAITILGEPIGASILAYLFFDETIRFLQFVGMALIFAAIVLASRKGKKESGTAID